MSNQNVLLNTAARLSKALYAQGKNIEVLKKRLLHTYMLWTVFRMVMDPDPPGSFFAASHDPHFYDNTFVLHASLQIIFFLFPVIWLDLIVYKKRVQRFGSEFFMPDNSKIQIWIVDPRMGIWWEYKRHHLSKSFEECISIFNISRNRSSLIN